MLVTKTTWISILNDEKPIDTYMTILVCGINKRFTDIGFYDGHSFKLWGRYSGFHHKDITHWAYMPTIE